MLASLLGIRLILLIGKTLPTPAPLAVTRALTRVEVTNDAEQGDGFQITFSLGKEKAFDYGLLRSGALDPFNRVVLGVALGVLPEVLIDGIITHHQVSPSNDPGMSTLTVTGKDVSMMLDLKERNDSYENQPDFLIVTRLIAGYAQYGLIPQATPTTDVPIMLQRIPRQQETDLKFIQRLAERNGFVFYVQPLTLGVNKAYWGPENRLSIPQPALTMNMGGFTNLKSLTFSQNALAPVATEGNFVEPITKTSIPIPSLPSLRIPPLAPLPTPPRRTVLLRETANQNPSQAATRAIAAVTRTPESVTGEGEVDVVRYGHVLRARRLVGVRGVGFSYNGNYYVRRVTHTIAPGEYLQKFTLTREGTGALLPVVRV
ncbi:MAG: hypothetical protein M3P51_05050 [Chloroflexota bacterium]|nr:hypothetical protein [Chloroflexota bacterium]